MEMSIKTLEIPTVDQTSPCRSNDEEESKCTNGFYGLLALAILIVAPMSTTLLPVHNIFTSPEYWYEMVFITAFWCMFYASGLTMEMGVALNELIKKKTTRVILELFMTLKITEILSTCFNHLVWSKSFGFFEPVPYKRNLAVYFCLAAIIVRIWYMIPKKTRFEHVFQKRFRAFTFRIFWGVFVTVQLTAINVVMSKVSRDFQWIVALTVPMTKEINDRIIRMLMAKTASPENFVEANFIAKTQTNVAYSFWLAITLAGIATKTTEFVLLGINFLLDMTLCYQRIRLDRVVSEEDCDKKKQQNAKEEILTELLLNEIAEVILPIAFIGAYTTAYFGPNKTTLVNVGCAIWGYQRVENLFDFLMPVVEMTLIDAGSIFLVGTSLWFFCHINIWKEYCKTIKKYWIYLALWGGSCISCVS